MNATATIQIRIDEKTKRAARKTLEEAGLDLSSGIKLFLHNVASTKSIPLDLRTANGYTVEQEQRILKEITDAEKNAKRYTDVRTMLAEI